MLRVCEKLRHADEKGRRYGLARAETGYLRALVDAMADTDRMAEVELLKTLGDVNVEKGRLGKDVGKFNTALALYIAAMVRCYHEEQADGIEHRYHYTERLLQGLSSPGKEQPTEDKEATTPAKVAAKFQVLDKRRATGGKTDSLLVGYAQMMVEAIVNDNSMLETEAIKSLGDVYLKRGTETGDTRNLTRATALYNRALSRCHNVYGTVVIVHRLLHTAKIRQDITTTRRKRATHTQRQDVRGRRGHFSPISAAPSSDGTTSQVDDISYRRYIQTADRDLGNGDLDAAEQNLAAALKLVHDRSKPNKAKEADCLCRLGDIYVERGKRTREVRKFTQAAALYNASIARTDGDKQNMVTKLQETERQFLINTCNLDCEPCPYSSALDHKKELDNSRARTKSQLETVHQEHNPYQYDEDDSVVKEVEVKRAEAIKNLFKSITAGRREFIQVLTDECIAKLGRPPCKYAFIGLGSQATELVTPYSDLEFAILIEEGKDDDDTQSSYRRYILTADRDLGNGDLDAAEQNLAAALKLVHDRSKPNKAKEADCLCRLGDVYVERGKRTGEGRKFTQAAALYNASIARTDGDKQNMIKKLQETERQFLRNTCNLDCEPCPYSSALDHRKELDNSRACAKSQLETIHQEHNPYQYDEDDPVVREVETKRAEAIKNLFKSITAGRREFIQVLTDECIAKLGPPPCKYAFTGLGSQATELVTPYSDLEFAILIEEGKDDDDDTQRYFLNLTHYLHLKVINLGETILPAMAIPSLNDFLSEDSEKDWFFDSVTPRGFAFDGFMPWASKTPFGRDETKSKPPVSLIQTPAKLAEYQHLHIALAEGYHLSDILRRVTYLTGDEFLVDEYTDKVNKSVDRSPVLTRLSAILMLKDNIQQIVNAEPTDQLLDVKKDIYRFPSVAVDVLSICCGITIPSVWGMIEELHKTQRISDEDAHHLTVLISISAELRLRTYIANGGQKDRLSPLTEMKVQLDKHDIDDTFVESVFYIPDSKMLFRYYYTAIPLKRCIVDAVKEENPTTTIFPTRIFDISSLAKGKITLQLLQFDASSRHLEAALKDSGGDEEKQFEILNELGSASYWRGGYKTAKTFRYHEQSLNMKKAIYGETTPHPDIAGSLNNIGACWSDLGDKRKAISYYEQSLKMRKAIYGETTPHPDIASSLNNIGACWNDLGDQTKAISYHEQSLKMRKAIYGETTPHPDIASSLNNIGNCWSDLGGQGKAISYHEKSLEMMKAIYGENRVHPDIAYSLCNIGNCWGKLGDYSKAMRYYELSLDMMKVIYRDNPEHPHIAAVLDNIRLCKKATSD
ncbi:PREDICTED: uncharacterized protein LOC109487239 [Branchiostoma belcheri]|uniref:Uncharacterized protein LOC109487239 n=1 Tax=Branchiostoma belcheri TaxID=7741 RepID=A0A6P5AAZ4_BRABE|nr:PREDICTED: uncharacterized protein LOC109487239 [Branchiostoma belcheri]